MIETSVLDTIAVSVERELNRVRAARPGLASRVERAGDIVVTHLSCRRQRVIRVRVRFSATLGEEPEVEVDVV